MRVVVREKDTNVIVSDRSFEDEAVYVGSRPGCAVHLPDLYVSPQHLLLSPDEEGSWVMEPLDPEKPARVDGQPLSDRRPMPAETEIEIGPYVLRVSLRSDRAPGGAAEERLSPTDLAEIKKYPLPPGSFTKRAGDPIEKLQASQIARLSRAGLDLGRCRDLHELADVSLSHLLQGFRARCAWIGLRRQPTGDLEVVGGRYTSGEACDAPEMAQHLRYRCLERQQQILVRRPPEGIVGSSLAVPIVNALGVLGMAYVDTRKDVKRFGTADLDALVVMGSHIAHQLETLLREQAREEVRVSGTELSVVRTIQEQLDPRDPPGWRNFQIASYTLQGQQNSGDVYDVMKLPGKEIAGLLIGNVRAEGAMLALLVAQVHASFRMAMLHGDPPHVFLRQLNHLLYGGGDRYVGCFVLVVDPAAGALRHCRAGRVGAIVVDARGQPRPFGAIEMPAVGVVRGFEYTTSEDVLGPGETLGLYTRGVTTATNANGERFREKRFINCLCDGFAQPAMATMNDLKTDLTDFFADGTHPDDMTVLLVHRAADA